MDEITFLVEEAEVPGGGYTARASGESIFTEADDLESLDKQMRDAVDCHFDKEEKPRTIRWGFEPAK